MQLFDYKLQDEMNIRYLNTFPTFFIIFLSLYQRTQCQKDVEKECVAVDVSLLQKIENEGFHRDIRWLIEVEPSNKPLWNDANCVIALRLDVNPGFFVNPDQIADLQRINQVFLVQKKLFNLQISAVVEGAVNVETPMHESTGHTVYIYDNGENVTEFSLFLPIHLRYQRAQITGGYAKVQLPKPTLLIRCAPNSIFLCDRKSKISAPCSSAANITCTWRNVTYKTISENVEMLVPIGDLDHYPLVSIVTLLIGCAGCIYVLSVLSTTRV